MRSEPRECRNWRRSIRVENTAQTPRQPVERWLGRRWRQRFDEMTAAEQLRSSCVELDRACAHLTAATPDALCACAASLEGVAAGLTALQAALLGARGDPDALGEARRLRASVRRAGVLLANASAYHARWNELVSLRAAGYRPGGEPAAMPRPVHVCLRG